MGRARSLKPTGAKTHDCSFKEYRGGHIFKATKEVKEPILDECLDFEDSLKMQYQSINGMVTVQL